MTIDDVIPRSLSDHIDNNGLMVLIILPFGVPIMMDNPIAIHLINLTTNPYYQNFI